MSGDPDLGGRKSLRVSYVWRDEVMNDAVLGDPKPVVLGSRRDATFTIPRLGLPKRYTILRPGARGYVLTLGAGMSGQMKLGGEEIDVSEWLERGAEGAEAVQGSFRATSVGPGDWGIIHLDGEGDHSFFFQFVKPDPPLPRATWRDPELLLPAIAFAVILHAVFLIVAFSLADDQNSFVFPGKRELAMDYLVERPPQPVEEEEEAPKAGEKDSEEKEPASTMGEAGKAGGEGEEPRKKAPEPRKGRPDEPVPERIQVGLLTERNRKTMERVRNMGGIDEDLGKMMARLGKDTPGSRGGSGSGTGTGFGPGRDGTGTLTRGGKGGSGGGGRAHGDLQTQKAIKTGGRKAPKGMSGGKGVKEVAVKVKTGSPGGDLGGLTKAQISKVVRSRQNLIRTCYQRQLQRNKGLAGRILIRWKIDATGRVKSARVRKTTMRNAQVEDCIVRVINRLKFPKPKDGSVPLVNFPFIFAQQ